MAFNVLRQKIRAKRSEVDRQLAIRDRVLEELEAERAKIKEGEQLREIARKAVIFLELVSESSRREVRETFQEIVSYSLKTVLGDDYRFEIEQSVKRNAAHADFYVSTDGYFKPADPLISRGGGVVDLLAFSLRVVLMELLNLPGPIVLDEPFKHLSPEHMEAAAEVVVGLSKRFNRQFIVVTHKAQLADRADVKIEL